MKKFFKKILYSLEDFIIFLIDKFIRFLRKKKKGRSLFKDIIYKTFIVFIALFMLFSGIFMIWFTTLKTPDINVFDDKLLGQSAKIYDRTGNVLLYDLSQKIRRTVVPLEQISPYIKNATIAIEDNDFYTHKGIKITSLIRAVFANIYNMGYSQGGSTITQQVVKNSLLTKDKKITRKIKEIFLALKLERNLTKDEILTLYLNNSPYGGNIYGIEEASQLFFNKKASDVTIEEAAVLASLPKAPSTYNPYIGKKDLLLERKNLVLLNMYKLKMITEDEYKTSKEKTIVFQPRNLGSIKAAHFVMYIKNQLEKKYGEEKLNEGGFKVITTLDYNLQRKGEEIVYNYVTTNQKNFGAENGAIVAIDPKNGQILSMIGSRNYFDTEIDGNYNIATANRQPGSSFKPFVYATAFNMGFLPETVLFDTKTEFSSSCTPNGIPKREGVECYSPQNYEGGFKGPISIRTALATSRNIPAVKTIYLVGVQSVINTARALGVSNLGNASDYGLSLALGSAEVSLLDMVSAYSVFPNNGIKNNITGILKVEDAKGNILEEFATSSKSVLSEQTARLINDVLSDPVARSSIFSRNYFSNNTVAMKTGTTNNSRDAWTIGYTPNIVMGAWMGNNSNKPMSQLASARIVSPMWKQFMDYILTIYPKEDFIKPEESSSDTKPFFKGVYRDNEGVAHSELYWIDRDDVSGPQPTNPSKDPLFNNFEYSINNTDIYNDQNLNKNNLQINLSNKNPKRNEVLIINVSGFDNETSKIDYYINDKKIGTNNISPFVFKSDLSVINNIEPENEFKIIEYKKDGTTNTNSVYFTTQE